MKIVGITGGIGSGKSTVCRIFETLGVPVFYADDEAKKLYGEARIRVLVAKLFGPSVLGRNKKVDNAKLAGIVFADRASLAKLNALIHPEVQKKFISWSKKQKGAKYLIKEAAIMIESGSHKHIDYLVLVTSPKELKINRLLNYRKWDIVEIEKRMAEQISDAEREKHADVIIANDEAHSLIAQVLKLHAELSGK